MSALPEPLILAGVTDRLFTRDDTGWMFQERPVTAHLGLYLDRLVRDGRIRLETISDGWSVAVPALEGATA